MKRVTFHCGRPQTVCCTSLLTFIKHETEKRIAYTFAGKKISTAKGAFPFLRRVGFLKPSSLQHYIETHLTIAERTRVQPVVFMFHAPCTKRFLSTSRGKNVSYRNRFVFRGPRFLVREVVQASTAHEKPTPCISYTWRIECDV